MKLVRIESCSFNPEEVCLVRQADHNDAGFATEVIMSSGSQLLKTPQETVERLLQDSSPLGGFSPREAPTLP